MLKKTYPDFLTILAQAFPEETDENRSSILEILAALPDIMDDEKIVIEDELRAKFMKFALQNLQINVLKTLDAAASHGSLSSKRRYQIIKCFESWLLNETQEEIKQDLYKSHLVNLCFQELRSQENTNEEAANALRRLMTICYDATCYPQLYQFLMIKLVEESKQ